MPLVDDELIAEGTEGEFEYPPMPIGDYFESIIRKNVTICGDAVWLVSLHLEHYFFF